MSAARVKAIDEALDEALQAPAGSDDSLEPWAWIAFVIAGLFLVSLMYLGSRPGGSGPVWVYTEGRTYLTLAALAVLVAGVVWSALRRPFLGHRRVYVFLTLPLVIGVANAPIPYPSSHEGRPSPVRFRLPVEGEWRVFWGGEKSRDNLLSRFYPDRRWGLHLVKEGEGGRARVVPPKSPADYYAYDEPVLSPSGGLIAFVRDGVPDSPLRGLAPGAPHFGNLVVVEVREREFVFFPHLRAGSIPVAVGDSVAAGDELGRVGASGFSPATPEPHVALHLQDTLEEGQGEAVPWYFTYRSAGRLVERGLPRGGVSPDGSARGELVAPAR